MTKSKLINAKGQVVRANLHPTKATLMEGKLTYAILVRKWARQGYFEMNRGK